MANDLLISAIRNAGLTVEEIADAAEVDPRTVQRWLAGRTPHPRYRRAVADTLSLTPAELWPDTVAIRRRTDLDELVGAWARTEDPDAIDWRSLLHGAEHHIDLLGFALRRVLESRGILKALDAKARAGCSVRILTAFPDSDPVVATDRDQRPPGRLTRRIHSSRHQLSQLPSIAGLQWREHRLATTHTILRFDDQLLLTIPLHGLRASHSPLMHLRRHVDDGLFDQLAGHYDAVWATAQPGRGPEDPEPPRTPQRDPADTMLDQLDYVWRPGA